MWTARRLLPVRPAPAAARRSLASDASARVMSAAKVALASVPLVDVAPLVNADKHPVDAARKQQVLDEMKAACVTHGFFTVPVADVIPKPLIDAAYRRTDEFLELPDAVKHKYHCKKTPNNRGWTPMFEEPSVRELQVWE